MEQRVYEPFTAYFCDIGGTLYYAERNQPNYFEFNSWGTEEMDEHFRMGISVDDNGSWVIDPVEHENGIESEFGNCGDAQSVWKFFEEHGPPPYIAE